MSRLRELAQQEWEPNQHKHTMSCGMQGAHSQGAGQRGSCTCGYDALIQQRNDLAALLADAKDALACSCEPVSAYPEISGDFVRCAACDVLARIEELEGKA